MQKNSVIKILIYGGSALIIGALAIVIWNFWPVIRLELDYWLRSSGQSSIAGIVSDNAGNHQVYEQLLAKYAPTDNSFSIVIPKLDANSRVVPFVDPFDEDSYSKALALGIAHAAGSALPGNNGNTFLFAHSGRNFYNNSGENVQFYLLDKLNKGDQVLIFYNQKLYVYEVNLSKKVWPDDISYLVDQDQPYQMLTLMSCWPAGINYQRQIVQARLVSSF